MARSPRKAWVTRKWSMTTISIRLRSTAILGRIFVLTVMAKLFRENCSCAKGLRAMKGCVIRVLMYEPSTYSLLVPSFLSGPPWAARRWLVLRRNLLGECNRDGTTSKAPHRYCNLSKASQGWGRGLMHLHGEACYVGYIPIFSVEWLLRWWETPSLYGNREGGKSSEDLDEFWGPRVFLFYSCFPLG